MSAVDKCCLSNRDSLTQTIHMQVSEKVNTFSQFFPAFPKSKLNFEHFQQKDDAQNLFFCEATVCEKRG